MGHASSIVIGDEKPKHTFWWKIKWSILLIWTMIRLRFPHFVNYRQRLKVKIVFDYDKIDREKLLAAEDALRVCGVKFDTARPRNGREWIIGWDIAGPCHICYMDIIKGAPLTPFRYTLADIWK